MKVLTIVGARPQFIKAAVISRAINEHNERNPCESITEVLVHTGQHYDQNMSEIFFNEMRIPKPAYYLGLGSGSHGAMTGRMLENIERIIEHEKPDVTLVYGDTNSTLAGALAAVKLHVPLAHVEAGLRSFNMWMPEEVNRILTDRISNWLFCPTDTAVSNLQKEGFCNGGTSGPFQGQQLVRNVGDVMFDAVLFYREIAHPTDKVASLTGEMKERFYLATIHRAENSDDPVRLRNIVQSLNSISKTTPVVLPLHPRTRKSLEASNLLLQNIYWLEPVGYFDMVTLLANCKGVFTDSGGIQKEAFFFYKPCITLREETEWIELVENGFSTLVGADIEKIFEAERNIGNQNLDYSKPLYGAGDAGKKIVQILLEKS